MKENKGQRTLLVEILIAVLFFALCSTALLRMFVAAKECSQRAGIDNIALMEAQDLAERLYVSQDWEALLAEDGFAEGGGQWLRDARSYQLAVRLDAEDAAAGELKTATIRATREDWLIVELPSVRYEPREAMV